MGQAGRSRLGDRLRGARQLRGWTREELAVRAGVSWSGIAQIESGRRRNVRPGTLSALAQALEVTIDYLVDAGTSAPVMLTHRALIYGSDEDFVSSVGPFLAEGVERGDPCLVATTDRNIELIREFLDADGRRVGYVRSRELYTEPSTTLTAYQEFVDRELGRGGGWARIVGEPVWADRSKAQARHWCEYESLLNLALATRPVTVVCPYDERDVAPSILRQAHATHPETVSGGTVARSADYVEPVTFVLGGTAGAT